jgi:cobalamin synthase
MELIGYYLLFAFSTAITACIFWFWPLVQQARTSGIQNTFTQYPKTSTVIYVLVSTVVAPLLLPPMFSEQMAQKFSSGLAREILQQDPKI